MSFHVWDRLWTGQSRDCDLIPGRRNGLYSSPKCIDWLWGPSRFQFTGYKGLFTRV